MCLLPPRWSSGGAVTYQVTGEDAYDAYRLAFGRGVAEVAALFAPPSA